MLQKSFEILKYFKVFQKISNSEVALIDSESSTSIFEVKIMNFETFITVYFDTHNVAP